MTVAAILAALLSVCLQQEAIYDGVQVGDLPPMRYERRAPAVDVPFPSAISTGPTRIAPPGKPRWDVPRQFPELAPFERLPLEPGVVLCSGTGVASDGRTPLSVAFDQSQRALVVWEGLDPFHAVTVPMSRGDSGVTSVDAMGGTLSQKADVSYSPRSVTVLHGTILLHCQRNRLTSIAPITWQAEGISIVRLDRTPQGAWEQSIHADLSVPGGTASPSALGQPRGWVSSMNNYYPSRRGGPLREAWIPVVDYLHQSGTGATGGQLFLMRAHRARPGSAWQLEGPVLLHEETGPVGRHFHVAGWTPNGVLLSIGDSEESEVKLFRCADWKHFADPTQWSVEDGFHGAIENGVPSGGANQFWACAPGSHANELLVGADNVSGAIYSIEIPDTPGKRATFSCRFGVPPGDEGDQGNSSLTCNVLQRPTPERDERTFGRVFYEGAAAGVEFSRAVLSQDARHFDVVGRLPTGQTKVGYATLHGEWLLCPPLASGPTSYWASPLDQSGLETRGLRIDPPGDNEAAHPAGVLTGVSPASGFVVTPLTPGDPLFAAYAASLPWNAPIWRVRAGPGHGSTILNAALRLASWDGGSRTLPMMVANLRSANLRVRGQLSNANGTWATTFAIVTRGEWSPCTLTTPPNWGFPAGIPGFSLVQIPPQPEEPLDFLFSVGGIYRGIAAGLPLPTPSAREAFGERWSQPLGVGAHGVTVEWWNPELGTDSSLVDGAAIPAILTVLATSGDALEIRMGNDGRLQGWHWRRDSAGALELGPVTVLSDQFLYRGDPARIEIESHDGGLWLASTIGGMVGEAPSIDWVGVPLRGDLASVHAGNRFGHVKVPMTVHRVATFDPKRGAPPATTEVHRCPYDFDGDGDQDVEDAFMVLLFAGECPEPDACPWDIDGSGSIDVIDAITFQQMFDADPCP